MEWWHIVVLLGLGLAAGALGGLLGIGGSVLMIPVLTLVLHRDAHIAQAAAMIVNVFVAVPALFQHHRVRAVQWDIVRRMLPAGVVCILIGVVLSNRLDGEMLKFLFGAFLLIEVARMVLRIIHRQGEVHVEHPRRGWAACGFVGGVMGLLAGVLGIGGGALAVPLLQRVSGLPLRQCIATTSAVMCVTALFGAIVKNLALEGMGFDAWSGVRIAICLAPTAVVGGLCGATLTHALPFKWVRLAFVLLLAWASANLLGVL